MPMTLRHLCAGDDLSCIKGLACFPEVSRAASHTALPPSCHSGGEWCRNVLINGELLKVEVQTITAQFYFQPNFRHFHSLLPPYYMPPFHSL